MNAPYVLAVNGALQVIASSLLGFAMLVPLQPWGRSLAPRWNRKALLAAHLDWIMLAFMQWGAAFAMTTWPAASSAPVALLLVFGGWTNATPYLLRGAGIDAFVLAGDPRQRLAATISGLSSLAITVAWIWLVALLLQAGAP